MKPLLPRIVAFLQSKDNPILVDSLKSVAKQQGYTQNDIERALSEAEDNYYIVIFQDGEEKLWYVDTTNFSDEDRQKFIDQNFWFEDLPNTPIEPDLNPYSHWGVPRTKDLIREPNILCVRGDCPHECFYGKLMNGRKVAAKK